MMTVSICAFAASLFSVASPTASYRHQSAPQGVAQVERVTRQGAMNGRGQVWRTFDVRVGSPTTVARSSTTTRSFLIAGK